MILTLLLLVVLAWQFYIGFSRGLVLQAYYTVASLISLAVAYVNYRPLANLISLWIPYSNPTQESVQNYFTSVDLLALDTVFYNGIAFFAIYLATYLVLRFVGIFVHVLKLDIWSKRWQNLLAGALSLLVTLVGFSLLLSILATVTMASLQNVLTSSPLINALITSFPPLTQLIQTWWTVGV